MTAPLSPQAVRRERFGLGTFALVLAGLAAAAPILLGPGSLRLVGVLPMIAGLSFGAGAGVAMRARVESDRRLTSTTDRRIAWLVGEAARLRAATTATVRQLRIRSFCCYRGWPTMS